MAKTSERLNVTFDRSLKESVRKIQARRSLTTMADVVKKSVKSFDILTEMIEKGGIIRVHYPDGTTDRIIFG